jgi:hypothetical protein
LEESKSAMEPVLAALGDYFVRQMPKPTPAEKVASALP